MQDVKIEASVGSPRETMAAGDALLNIPVNLLTKGLARLGLLRKDLDYHLMRASMVLVFLLFGYQKWFEYEAQVLIPFISNGPLISWLYPVFGIRGASWFLGVAEWSFGALLLLGFWNKKLGMLGALVRCSLLCSGHDRPLHDRLLGAVCGDFGNGRKLHFPMKDVYCCRSVC